VPEQPTQFTAERAGVTISGEQSGRRRPGRQGTPVVLLHGLTATRRYVVMGSRSLERSEHHVIAYDARGHGHSAPAPAPDAYTYPELAEDLEAVLDATGTARAVLAGASMGAHTALHLALSRPARVAALVLITPSFDPAHARDAGELARWDALSDGLREGGVEGFVRAYDLAAVPEAWRETVATVLRQRLSAHDHPGAVADALRAVPRSAPFESLDQLAAIDLPTLVVASRDEADPGHPLAVGELYARTIPGARLVVEEPGPPARSPIAWQGGALSRLIAELTDQVSAG
jgi:pimeloyl-ACP methyl ester carboxylesterase